MRPSILPNLLAAAARNVDRGAADFGLFEAGPQYAGDAPDDQAMVAAGIRRGAAVVRHWQGGARDVDAYDAKADVLTVLGELGAPVAKLQVVAEAPGWYHPGRSGTYRLGPKNVLAHFGEIHPNTLKLLDCEGPCVGFEIYLDALPQRRRDGSANRGALDLKALQPVDQGFRIRRR